MPIITGHLADGLLSKIDRIFKEKGISRNRFSVEACEQALNESGGLWPEGSKPILIKNRGFG